MKLSGEEKPHLDATQDGWLAKSDSYFRYFAQSTDAFVWSATASGTLNFCNPYFSHSADIPLGTRIWSWPELIHPEDLARVTDTVERHLYSGMNFTFGCRLRSPSGSYSLFEIRGASMRSDTGRILRWLGTAAPANRPERKAYFMRSGNHIMGMTDDVRASLEESLGNEDHSRRLAAELMAKRFEFLAQLGTDLSASLEILKVLENLAKNAIPHLADWWGVMELLPDQTFHATAFSHRDPALFHIGWVTGRKTPHPTAPPLSGSYYVINTGRAELLPEVTEENVYQNLYPQEQAQLLLEMGIRSCIVAPLKARGRILGTMVFAVGPSRRRYDESDLKLAEEVALRLALAIDNSQLYHQAQQVNRAKDEFLATLSHELRTPLNVIMGHSEILHADWATMDPAEILFSLDAIQRNSRIQIQLIDDLLNVSAIILGKVKLHLSQFNIYELLENAIDSLQMAAEVKGLHIVREFREPRLMVFADPTRIQQIVWNLLTNAIKYSSGGRIKVAVSSNASSYIIRVTDSGIGIDPEFLPYVFDRFRQEESGVSRRFGGLGLGLSIVRNLVELHGGFVEVESAGRGKGSSFSVTLPLKPPGAEADLGKGQSSDQSAYATNTANQLRRLVTSANQDTCALVRNYLESQET